MLAIAQSSGICVTRLTALIRINLNSPNITMKGDTTDCISFSTVTLNVKSVCTQDAGIIISPLLFMTDFSLPISYEKLSVTVFQISQKRESKNCGGLFIVSAVFQIVYLGILFSGVSAGPLKNLKEENHK